MAVFVGGPLDGQFKQLDQSVSRRGWYEVMERPPMPSLQDIDKELVITVHEYRPIAISGMEVWAIKGMVLEQVMLRLLSPAVMRYALRNYVENRGLSR